MIGAWQLLLRVLWVNIDEERNCWYASMRKFAGLKVCGLFYGLLLIISVGPYFYFLPKIPTIV